jgi:cysteine sulfinate desulfinase/cysteine desulfurase-like protein
MIYFDNSATTAIDPTVLKTYTDVTTKIMGNPSSLHNLGTVAGRMLRHLANKLPTYSANQHRKFTLPQAVQKVTTGS